MSNVWKNGFVYKTKIISFSLAKVSALLKSIPKQLYYVWHYFQPSTFWTKGSLFFFTLFIFNPISIANSRYTIGKNRKCYPKFMQSKFDSRLSTQLCWLVPCGPCSSFVLSELFPDHRLRVQIYPCWTSFIHQHNLTPSQSETHTYQAVLVCTNTHAKRGFFVLRDGGEMGGRWP